MNVLLKCKRLLENKHIILLITFLTGIGFLLCLQHVGLGYALVILLPCWYLSIILVGELYWFKLRKQHEKSEYQVLEKTNSQNNKILSSDTEDIDILFLDDMTLEKRGVLEWNCITWE